MENRIAHDPISAGHELNVLIRTGEVHMPYTKGQSGNPSGRPPGIKDRRVETRELFESRQVELIEKAIDMALQGDTRALRMCLDRIVPPIKDAPIQVVLDGYTLADQARSVLTLVAEGEHSVQDVAQLMSVLATMARVIDVDEFERRLTALEQGGLNG
jgi:hypothetical protein